MEAVGTLELIAEIAVAFAGFTGLVGVFRARDDKTRKQIASGRILIEYSLAVLLYALSPVILWHLTADEGAAWQIGSGIHAAVTILYYWRRGPQLLAGAALFGGRREFYAVASLDAVCTVALLANAAGVTPWEPSATYLVVLAYNVAGMGYTFLHFASPLWTAEATE